MSVLKRVTEAKEQKVISESLAVVISDFVTTYTDAAKENGCPDEQIDRLLNEFIDLVLVQLKHPYLFESFHQRVKDPIDYYQFGLEIIRPLIRFDESKVEGINYLHEIEQKIARGENVILLANHQTEPDPQVISLLIEKEFPRLAEEMIFVAGHRVITDPMAIPFSLGRNLLCIFSKRYIETEPEKKQDNIAHNQGVMKKLMQLLNEGGKCIYVAPSGGRDRIDPQTREIILAPFDAQSIEMFNLIAQQCLRPTHFHPLAIYSYHLLPPPESIEKAIGEKRRAQSTPVFLSFGPEIEMAQCVSPTTTDKKERRQERADFIWNLVNRSYASMIKLFICLILVFTSCTRSCHQYDVMGPDEFVVDSYMIRQGKFSILEMEGIEVEEVPCDAMDEYADSITEDDILNIFIYHPKRKDLMESFQFINGAVGGFRVHCGYVDLPDIDPVEVEGLSLEEARIRIQERLRAQIQDVEVFITYKDRLRRRVELTGLVAQPTVPVDGKIRLYEVLANAHLPPEANLFMSYVSREGHPIAVDLYKLINEGDMTQNIVMRGGDKIFIASKYDSSVMIMGEVNSPRPVHLPYGFMSLREAIVHAGGIPFTGDKKHIQVIRGNLQSPKIYVLAWQHIIHLPNDSLLLMPGDTVYVSATPITEWNRFISQLLPSAQAFQMGWGIYGVTAIE